MPWEKINEDKYVCPYCGKVVMVEVFNVDRNGKCPVCGQWLKLVEQAHTTGFRYIKPDNRIPCSFDLPQSDEHARA